MKIKLKRKEVRALLKLLAKADESENGDTEPVGNWVFEGRKI